MSGETSQCIFCRIVAGQVPATKVYEDDAVLAFLDIGPVVKGHTLVIPKAHHDLMMQTPPDLLARMMAVVQKVAQAQVAGLDAEGINILQSNGAVAGQEVPHVHLHVIPRFQDDGHRWNWSAQRYGSPAEMHEWAERLRRAL